MLTPTDDNRELLTVIAFMRAAAGKREELKAALEALIEPAKQRGRMRQPRPASGRGGPDFANDGCGRTGFNLNLTTGEHNEWSGHAVSCGLIWTSQAC